MKKVLSLLTSLVMVISLFSVLPTMSVGALTSGDYEYEILDDGTVEITDYTGSATKLTISSTINGKKVTSIGVSAFSECDLTSITIPNSVKTIENSAFSYCSYLTNIDIPASTSKIGVSAFYRCISLTNISVDLNNMNYSSIDGILFNKDKTELIKYPARKASNSYIIVDSVTSIGEQAFQFCSNLTSITLPDSLAHIGNYAFDYCTNLTSISIPNSVKELNSYVFGDCYNLTSIVITDGVTNIEDGAFWKCKNLTSIIIPDSITSVGDKAFYGCDNLTIKCYENSTAQQYAIDNDIPYELIVPKPTSFKMALNSSSSVRLSWNKVPDVDGYIIEQYKNNNWTQIGKITNPSTVQYSVKGLASGTTYKFRMKAYKTISGNTVYSDYTNTLTTCTKPATPTAKMALNSSTSVRLSWNKITGAGGYIVEQHKGGKWVRLTKITSPSTLQYSVKGLASGTTYKFRVRAYKMLSGKAYYSDYSSTITACTKPATVKFTVTPGSKKATVKWSKVTGASGYIVYYRTSPSKGWTRLKKVGSTTTSFTKTGLTRGKTYYFTVRSYKISNNKVYYGSFTSKSAKIK